MPSVKESPQTAPSFQFPLSSSTVTVRVIDRYILVFYLIQSATTQFATKANTKYASTTRLQINPDIFWRPKIDGLDPFQAPVFCFLISHGDEHILFDLGVRRDWENYAPTTVKLIKATTT
ncbi:MAG: hypothetical protein LQ341_004021, partial [Variospora aurantia]